MTKRIIVGTCTSGSVNSHHQRVVPDGLRWNVPMPLFFKHSTMIRRGEVLKIWRELDKIKFEARVDDLAIWAGIESGEYRAASIKLADTRSDVDGAGALVVNQGEIVEVSICREGANPDAVFSMKRKDPVFYSGVSKSAEV